MRTLGIGDTGDDVKRWQEYLATQGFQVEADGKFGPATLAATRAMQRKMGVRPDGKVGARTLGKSEPVPLPRTRPTAGQQTVTPAERSPFVSADKEYDPIVNRMGASNRNWDEEIKRQRMQQMVDALMADRANQGPPPPIQRDFTDQPVMTMDQLPNPAIQPNFGWADDNAPQLTVGQPPAVAGGVLGQPIPGAPAGIPVDPVKRDMMIRALLQQAGG